MSLYVSASQIFPGHVYVFRRGALLVERLHSNGVTCDGVDVVSGMQVKNIPLDQLSPVGIPAVIKMRTAHDAKNHEELKTFGREIAFGAVWDCAACIEKAVRKGVFTTKTPRGAFVGLVGDFLRQRGFPIDFQNHVNADVENWNHRIGIERIVGKDQANERK